MSRIKTCKIHLGGPFVAALLLNLSLLLFTADRAQAESDDHVRGMILVADVKGSVDAIDTKDKSTRSLKVSDILFQDHKVEVGEDSMTVLAFGNGSVITLTENTTLGITKFLKDPFSAPFAKAIDKNEPGTSVTSLELEKGEIVCSVKKLRIDQGSSLDVETPVGTASVRGTVFALEYSTDDNGNTTCTLSVTEGSVTYTDSNGQTQTANAGQKITFNGTVKFENGTYTITPSGPISKDPLSPAETNRINSLANGSNGKANNEIVKFTNPNLGDSERNNTTRVVINPAVTSPNN
ncbi:MAG: FecR family protein [Akkermansiaceae bacterium]|nr:FecR family protein [Akkermansiaceae bacterium]